MATMGAEIDVLIGPDTVAFLGQKIPVVSVCSSAKSIYTRKGTPLTTKQS